MRPSIEVIAVTLNDPRVNDAVASVLNDAGSRAQVVIADGGSRPDVLETVRVRWAGDPRVRVLLLPGRVAETRAAVLGQARGEIVAFIDSDERAPPGWLDRLTKPIKDGEVEFTGGPTRAWSAPRSGPERYVVESDERFYENDVPFDVRLLPCGNSAWQLAALKGVGGFDGRMGGAGEDFDLNQRAHRAGLRGRFLPEAWLWHDQSHLDSYRKVVRRKFLYFRGAALAYRKNGVLAERSAASVGRLRIHHWLDAADLVLKPLALLAARRIWRDEFASVT